MLLSGMEMIPRYEQNWRKRGRRGLHLLHLSSLLKLYTKHTEDDLEEI